MRGPAVILLAVLVSAPAWAQGERGLVGYWNFDEGQGLEVRDSSGHNHHGRIHGGARWVEGRRGAALEFNGTDSSVEIADSHGLNLAGDMTFMAWLKTSSDDARDRLIFGDTAGLAVNRNVTVELDRGALHVGHGNDACYESFSPSLKFAGDWQHLAIVFEKPRYYLYVNGSLHEVGPLALPVSRTRGAGRAIGGWWAGHFKGLIDEVRLYSRAVSEREVLAMAEAPAPPPDQQARISLTPRLKQGRLGFEALFTRLPAAETATLRCTLTLKGQTQVRRDFSAPLKPTRPDSERALAETTIPMDGLPHGTYVLAVRAEGAAGEPLASVAKEVAIPEAPEWFGSKAGVTDAVLAPYTPIAARDEAGAVVLNVRGRTYRLGSQPPLEQAVSRGSPLLSGPARLRAVVEGKEVSWSQSPPAVRERTPARWTLEQSVSGGPLACKCLASLEYDGLLRTDWTLSSAAHAQIDSLTLEVPFRSEHARYLYTWPTSFGGGGFSGQLAQPMEFGFHPIVWIGDEARGLSWMCESEHQWAPDDPAHAIQVVPAGGETLLRVRIIGKSTALRPHEPLHYTFAFQATPLKPLGEDGWSLRFSGCPWYGYDYDLLKDRQFLGKPGLECLKELGVRTLIVTNWTPALAYPSPLDRAQDFKALVAACHAHGIRVIPYLGYQISEKAPEFPYLRDEVVVFPLSTNADKYPNTEPQMVSSVCLRSVWQDALVDSVARMMDEFDIDGVYLDSTNMPFPCMNVLHGCEARRADGTQVPVYPVFAVRDAFRRLYAVVRGRKAEGIIDSHVYDCMNSAALAFSTSYWNGEQLSAAEAPIDALPLDRLRTEFMGVNWGVPCDLLAYRLGSFRKALALSLPHDVLVRAWHDELPLASAIWRLADDFGRSEASFTPYYRLERPVEGLLENWIASVYRHPRNGALVIVSNLGRQEGRASLSLDWTTLGLDGPGQIVEGLTRSAIALKDGRLEIALPAGGWQYLWVRPGGKPR